MNLESFNGISKNPALNKKQLFSAGFFIYTHNNRKPQ